jgi:hypothetical protein
VIEFGAANEADRVLDATKALPRLLCGCKKKVTARREQRNAHWRLSLQVIVGGSQG